MFFILGVIIHIGNLWISKSFPTVSVISNDVISVKCKVLIFNDCYNSDHLYQNIHIVAGRKPFQITFEMAEIRMLDCNPLAVVDNLLTMVLHDGVIKRKHFPRCWPFVRGIHRSPVNSPHKGQWRGALTFSLICAWTNSWANNGGVGDLRRHRAHYDVRVMF